MMGESATGMDRTVAHSARMWNYWLGGKDNYQVDRDVAEAMLAIYPGYGIKARTCRYFLFRAVRFLTVEAGVRQFLDIGTGLPTAENTHQVAQRFAPESRIVYVDNDPLVLAHARSLLTSSPRGRHPLHRRRSARTRPDPRRGTPDAGLPGADRPAAARRARPPRRLRRRPSPSWPTAPRRPALGQLPGALRRNDDRRRLRQGLGGLQGHRRRSLHPARGTSRSSAYFAGLDMIEPGVVRHPPMAAGARARRRARRRRRVRRHRPQALTRHAGHNTRSRHLTTAYGSSRPGRQPLRVGDECTCIRTCTGCGDGPRVAPTGSGPPLGPRREGRPQHGSDAVERSVVELVECRWRDTAGRLDRLAAPHWSGCAAAVGLHSPFSWVPSRLSR